MQSKGTPSPMRNLAICMCQHLPASGGGHSHCPEGNPSAGTSLGKQKRVGRAVPGLGGCVYWAELQAGQARVPSTSSLKEVWACCSILPLQGRTWKSVMDQEQKLHSLSESTLRTLQLKRLTVRISKNYNLNAQFQFHWQNLQEL